VHWLVHCYPVHPWPIIAHGPSLPMGYRCPWPIIAHWPSLPMGHHCPWAIIAHGPSLPMGHHCPWPMQCTGLCSALQCTGQYTAIRWPLSVPSPLLTPLCSAPVQAERGVGPFASRQRDSIRPRQRLLQLGPRYRHPRGQGQVWGVRGGGAPTGAWVLCARCTTSRSASPSARGTGTCNSGFCEVRPSCDTTVL